MATPSGTSASVTNLSTLPKTFRVGGSGFTAFHWSGQVIGFAQSVRHTSPQPVAPPAWIQPLDAQHPLQIIVPAAIGPGSLEVQMFEMYNSKVWDRIMEITDNTQGNFPSTVPPAPAKYHDLSEIFLRLSSLQQGISCTKIIYPPNAGVRGGPTTRKYADQYYNCVITDIRDDETIIIGTMEVLKTMTIMYTYMQRLDETTSNL